MTGVAGNSRLGTVTLMMKRWRDNCVLIRHLMSIALFLNSNFVLTQSRSIKRAEQPLELNEIMEYDDNLS